MTEEFTPNVNDIIEGNARFVAGFHEPDLGVQPTRNVAVIACMDSRMDIFALLGLANGESHIIRNGGGVITDDVIRSLCLSQRKLGTREVILVHYTDCGLQTVTEDSFKAELEDELGIKPWWALESFVDPYADGWAGSVDLVAVRAQLADWHAAAVQRGRGVPALMIVRHPEHVSAARIRGVALADSVHRQEADYHAVQRGELAPYRFLERHAWSPYRHLVAALVGGH